MIKSLALIFILTNILFATATNRTFDCTKIFEERKLELVERLEDIDEQTQALQSLKEATSMLLDKKKAKIDEEMQKIKAIQAEVDLKEENIKKLLAENKKILEDIKKNKLSKISTLYAKMKAASAANIFAKMEVKEATDILATLPPKVLGKIFAKMDATKAAELTHELALMPPEKKK